MVNQHITILIVDDEPIGRETLAALLHDQGYQLVFAETGTAALAQAAALNPDLMLLDVMMPGLDGFMVCRRIRADPMLAELPIILLTALDDADSRLIGLDAGADDFVSKPFDRIELRMRIHTITRLNRYRRLLVERVKFERVIELAPNGLLILDAHGMIQLANSAMGRLLNALMPPTGEVPIRLFIEDASAARFAQELQQVIAEPSYTARFESVLLRTNGAQMPVVIDACSIEWDGLPAAQVCVRDISERAQAEAQRQRQLARLSALHMIDRMIAANLDLKVILRIVLDQAIEHLAIDAAAVLRRQPQTQTFAYALLRGHPHSALRQQTLRLGEGYGGQVALERRTLRLADLAETVSAPLPTPLSIYYGVPLIVKGQVEGVLEVFCAHAITIDVAWLEFLETLASQFAIAIDHANLFEMMWRANNELSLAYTYTLEGWARALELRDKETEGHAQRVTEMTLALARALGVGEDDIVHIERGALLHDIGKMGIADSILLKPGPLTDEEWQIMRRHPGYAYDMLSPITYLEPALAIPYCHHEKWDGTGYPRGLKGEAIPFAARIFAVVDVWDALRADRPYRKGWPEEQVRAHLLAASGTHFDPQIIEVFLRQPEVSQSRRLAILIVDDDEALTRLAQRILEEQFTIFTATSAEQALAIISRQAIAVILTDQRMPTMTGVQLLQRAKQISPQTIGILSSGYLDNIALSDAMNLGNVRGYIHKPWAPTELRRRITEVVQHYQQIQHLSHERAALHGESGAMHG
jgi:response regulator RpfG family c-di-GMP phosphodiesterase